MESWILDLGLQKSIDRTRIAVQPLYSLSDALKTQKPYFGRRLSAFQSPPVRYALLAAVGRYSFRDKQKVRVLEIGSWAGASTITLGAVIRQLGIVDSAITCVDSWGQYFVQEDEGLHYKNMNAAAVTGSIEILFHHNIRASDIEGMIRVAKAVSRDVLPSFADGAFDFIYIDGSHKHDDVLYDFDQAKRLVCDGGIICGDDLELVKNDIDQTAHRDAVKRAVDFVHDPRSGAFYHPGVTEAVASAFGDVWHDKGLWCVERSGSDWNIPVVHAQDLDIPVHLQHAVEVPYGSFMGYELFQLGEQFVAYPASQPFWFQNRLIQGSLEDLILMIDSIQSQGRSTELVEEGYCGFNIIRHNGGWYGFAQALGGLDIPGLTEAVIHDMRRNRTCVSGNSAGDVKMEILRLATEQLEQRVTSLQQAIDDFDSRDVVRNLLRSLRDVCIRMERLVARKEAES